MVSTLVTAETDRLIGIIARVHFSVDKLRSSPWMRPYQTAHLRAARVPIKAELDFQSSRCDDGLRWGDIGVFLRPSHHQQDSCLGSLSALWHYHSHNIPV